MKSVWGLILPWTVIIIHYKMFNLVDITNENKKKYDGKWPYIPDHSYRFLIIGVCESGKANALLNVMSQQDDIDKIICMKNI